MKNRFSRLMSALLCVTMLLSTFGFSVVAEGEATQPEYYVQKGATGDGRSQDNPAGSIADIVTTINTDGYEAGDIVTVYVIDSGENDTCAAGGTINSDIVLGYNDNTPNHTATIRYTSADDRALIAHKSWADNVWSDHLKLCGPTIFENIDILELRNTHDSMTDIVLNRYNAEFINVNYYTLSTSNSVSLATGKGHLTIGANRKNDSLTGDQNVTIDEALYFKNIVLLGYTDAGCTQTLDGDLTVRINGGSLTELELNSSAGQEIVTGDLSVVLSGNTSVATVKNTTAPVIAGSMQFVSNYGSTADFSKVYAYTTTDKNVKTPKYFLDVQSGEITLDVTETAGSFAVTGSKVAFAVSGKTVYYSENGVLTVPAGDYKVYATDSADTVKTDAEALIVSSEDFKVSEWETLADGGLKAKIVPVLPEGAIVYYVQHGGGTDGGLTPEDPVETVADAVPLINAEGYDADDTVYIVIMNDDKLTDEQLNGYPFYWYDSKGNFMKNWNFNQWNSSGNSYGTRGRFTAWAWDGGPVTKHSAKIVVTGYSDDAYLSQSTLMGHNTKIILNGPTEFKNLTIVTNRQCDREVFINGYDATFTNVDFAYQTADEHVDRYYDGIYPGHMYVAISGDGSAGAGGGKVVFNSPIENEGLPYGLNLLSNGYVEFANPISIYLNGASENGSIVWGYKEAKMLAPLSIIINNGSYQNKIHSNNSTLFLSSSSGGAIQVIANNGTTPIEVPSLVENGDRSKIWILSSADTNGNTIDVTETAGTFVVNSTLDAVAENKTNGGQTRSKNGLLTLAAGEYTITYEEPIAETVKIYADGVLFGEYEKGKYVFTPPSLDDNHLYKFGGWAKDGKLFAWGSENVQFNEDTYLTSIWNLREGYSLVFFDEVNGDDENDGLTESAPVQTMERAFAIAEASDAERKTIVILGTYTAASLPEHTGMVTLAGPVSGESFINIASSIFTNGPLGIEYITINQTKDKFVNADSNKLVIGKGLKDVSGSFGFSTHVSNENGDSATAVVDIFSDALVYVGSYYNDQRTYTDGALVTINGGSPLVTFCGDGWENWQQGPVFSGKPVTIVHNGGTPTISTTKNRYTPYFETDVQYISNYGIDVAELPEFNIADGYGLYVIYAGYHDTYSSIEPTDVAGTFKVNAPEMLDAVATASNGLSIRSVDGILTLTPGTYSVHYEEHVDQLYSVYTDGKLHATVGQGGESTLPYYGNNYIYDFKGWKDINAEDVTYAPGATITVNADTYLEAIWATREVDHNVFLDVVNGKDENNGLTKDTPVKTIEKAFEIADDASVTKSNRKIAIIGTFTSSSIVKTGDNYVLPAHNNMIRLTGDGFNESVLRLDVSFTANGPIRLEHITINATEYKFVNSDSSKIEFSDGVKLAEGSWDLATHINGSNKNCSMGDITTYTDCIIYVGANYNTDTRKTDGALVTVKAGNPEIRLYADASGSANYPTIFTGKPVSIVQFGGKPSIKVYERGIFETDVQYIANYATEVVELPEFTFSEGHGLYVLKTVYSESWNYLETTETTGVFNIVGGMDAIATSEDGKQYASANGVLTIARPGIYTVEFVDEIFYTNDGETITFNKDFSLDLETAYHKEIEGKIFIGWTNANGEGVTDFNFVAGDVLTANYIDFNANDFYIEGAQIRLKSGDTRQGLRFVVTKTDNMDALPGITGYGSVVVPSLALGKSEELKLGGVYTYNGDTYAAAAVPADNIFAEGEGFEQYTVCIVGITTTNYARMFTVRGYINYTDLNEINRTLYTDYYATNIVNVAQEGINQGDKNSEYFEKVIETNKAFIAEKYAVSDVNTKTIPANNVDGSLVSIEGLEYFDDFYQLGGAGEGIIVSEITIETDKTDAEPLEIFQLSDLHFNYVNDQDFADNDEVIMSSYRGREWLADGASLPNAIRSLEYASQGDFTVVTGDVLDYLSWGALELTQKYIFDAYPETFVTLGNHDPSKFCQTDRNDVVDYTSREYKYQWIQDHWNHDVYYSSKVLDNRLMIIQIDNGSDVFWDNQIQPFADDLALARANGYDILMFFHIPLVTNNPEEESVAPIRRNDTGAYNYKGNGGFFIGNKAKESDATETIYNMIVSNGDIIKGVFAGHMHSNYYTEILAKTATGADTVIPQFVISGTPYDGGHVMKITVK